MTEKIDLARDQAARHMAKAQALIGKLKNGEQCDLKEGETIKSDLTKIQKALKQGVADLASELNSPSTRSKKDLQTRYDFECGSGENSATSLMASLSAMHDTLHTALLEARLKVSDAELQQLKATVQSLVSRQNQGTLSGSSTSSITSSTTEQPTTTSSNQQQQQQFVQQAAQPPNMYQLPMMPHPMMYSPWSQQFKPPKFDGTPSKFRSFWQHFKVIHDDPFMPKLNKLVLLIDSTTGKARESLDPYEVIEENYDTIVRKLQEEYGDPNKAIKDLVSTLMKLPLRGQPGNSLQTLNSLQSLLIQLEVHGENTNTWTYYEHLLHRIPQEVFSELRHNGGIPQTTAELRKKAYNIYKEIHEELECQTTVSDIIRANKGTSSSNPNRVSPRASLEKCVFCGKHSAKSDCRTVPDVTARKEILTKSGKCFYCFSDAHRSNVCPNPPVCSKCSGKHNTFLCHNDKDKPASSEPKTLQKEKQTRTHVTSAVNLNTSRSRNDILLITASTKVQNPSTKTSQKAVIFIDTGSEASFIHQKLAKRLRLTAERIVTLHIKPFEAEAVPLKTMETTVNLRLADGTWKPLKVYVVDNLIGKVKRATIDDDAMPHIHEEAPGILIGMDQLTDVSKLQMQRDPDSGKVVILTSFGEVRAGPLNKFNSPDRSLAAVNSPKMLKEKWDLWMHGPTWLQGSSDIWPSNLTPAKKAEYESDDAEEESLIVQATKAKELMQMPQPKRFLDLSRLCTNPNGKTLPRILKSATRIANRLNSRADQSHRHNAWTIIIPQTQAEFPPTLADAKKMGVKADLHGILRCHPRMDKSDLSDATKHPIWLPRQAVITELILCHIHTKNQHCGAIQTLSLAREVFWIPQGRKTTEKAIRHHCDFCSRDYLRPYALPNMPDLPQCRVTRSLPFQHCGFDYAGPLRMKATNGEEKVWIALFTCLATRAVHLELVDNLTAEAAINAVRRMIARRGKPKVIVSDNATNFTLAAQQLAKLWQGSGVPAEVISYCQSESIQWKFITPAAPWQGGVYERLIGIVKKSLQYAIGRSIPNKDELATLLTETEAVVNSRPLTTVGSDPDTINCLRPADFISPGAKLGIPTVDEEAIDDEDYVPPEAKSAEKLHHRLEKSTAALDKLWKYWSTEYLQLLMSRQNRCHKHPKTISTLTPEVGQVVMIHGDKLPRGLWNLAKIKSINRRSDGEIRDVTVVFPNGSEMTRTPCQLYPLEMDNEVTPGDADSDAASTEPDEHPGKDSDQPPMAQAPRKRGRPPKTSITPTLKRKRGRPKKDQVTPSLNTLPAPALRRSSRLRRTQVTSISVVAGRAFRKRCLGTPCHHTGSRPLRRATCDPASVITSTSDDPVTDPDHHDIRSIPSVI